MVLDMLCKASYYLQQLLEILELDRLCQVKASSLNLTQQATKSDGLFNLVINQKPGVIKAIRMVTVQCLVYLFGQPFVEEMLYYFHDSI